MQTIRDYQKRKSPLQVSKWQAPLWLRGLLVLMVLFFSLQYFQIKIYNFSEPLPFRGDSLYNPYENLSGKWLKSNFHTHAHAWGGLTNGHQPGDEVERTYRDFQYDIACISDYHAINPLQDKQHPLYIPVYEHGMNTQKAHRLAIGSEEVYFYDVLLYQSQSIKQYLVERLKEKAPVVCIAHPSIREGHSPAVLRHLGGYDCLEVLNRGRIATSHWDAALSAGKPVWVLGNDDCHDVTKSGFATCWTMVHAGGKKEEVLEALETGKTYGVYNKKQPSIRELFLKSRGKYDKDVLKKITTQDMRMTLQLWQQADTIRFIGQGGEIKAEATGTDTISYEFTASDTYIRTEIITPEADYYLNPVIRYEGNTPPQNYKMATTDTWRTFLWRYAILLVSFLCFRLLLKKETDRLLLGKLTPLPHVKHAVTG